MVFLSQQERKGKKKKNSRPSPVPLLILITSHTWPHPHDSLGTANYTDLNDLNIKSKMEAPCTPN